MLTLKDFRYDESSQLMFHRWGHPPRGGSRARSRSRSRDYRDDRGRGRGSDRPMWLEKYGPPTRTDYRVTVENLSSKVSHQMLQFFWEKVNTIVPGKLAGLEGLHEDSGRGDFFENAPKKIPTLSNNSFSNNQISGTKFSLSTEGDICGCSQVAKE